MGTLVKQSTLSKQASDVFHMTLDELQQTCGSGKPFGSMNMEEFLSTVWDKADTAPAEPSFNVADMQHSLTLQPQTSNAAEDFSGKTVDEVWQHISANRRDSSLESCTLGNFLTHVLPQNSLQRGDSYPLTDSFPPASGSQLLAVQPTARAPPTSLMPALPSRATGAVSTSGVAFPRPPKAPQSLPNRFTPPKHEQSWSPVDLGPGLQVHAAATVMTTGPNHLQRMSKRRKASPPPPECSEPLSVTDRHATLDPELRALLPQPPGGIRQARQRKRKEPDVIDERMDRQQKRMVKNRESAARSRARKQEYTAQLEIQVAELKRENRKLLEKVVKACPPPQLPVSLPLTLEGESLRRTRTTPI